MDRVLLLHGIARTSASLTKLARSLDSAGFATLNLDYPSRKQSLAALTEHVHREAAPFLAQPAGQMHIVTHSMGGLLARAYIARHRPPNLGKVVMLGPPNAGSELADLLARRLFYRSYFGPAGQQLGTGPEGKLSRLFGVVDYPVGVIAGDRALDPLGWLLLPRPNDGRVSVARTRVDGMTGHVTVHATHTLVVRNAGVIRHTIQFLRHGRFDAGSHQAGDGLTADPALPDGPSASGRKRAAD
ncbi:MAG: esterase/lipase family protein [Janthinobacterium lividum]